MSARGPHRLTTRPGYGAGSRGKDTAIRGAVHGAPLWVGIRTGLFYHRSPLIRLAPWLMLLAAVFLLVFGPFMLAPEVARRADLMSRLAQAQASVTSTEAAAAGLERIAGELPALRQELARAEAGLMPIEGLPGTVTHIHQHAAATGATLLSVAMGPYTPVNPGGAGSQDGQVPLPSEAEEPNGGPPSPGEGDASGAGGSIDYGRVTLEITAQGSWDQLARFAGRVTHAVPGVRVFAWSATSSRQRRDYQLRISGEIYVRGRPPTEAAVARSPSSDDSSVSIGGRTTTSSDTGSTIPGPTTERTGGQAGD